MTAGNAQFDGKTLTLNDVSPSVIMFTDRPKRMAEAISTASFVKLWDKGGEGGFQSEPPNVGLTSVVNGSLQTATLELSQPNLAGTTLTFQARVLEGMPPPTGEETSIFFDDFNWGGNKFSGGD